MTEEAPESSIPRPSVEGAPAGVMSAGSSSTVRKRAIMTKKFWSAEDIRRLFRTLDQDSSGRLSFEEFASGLKELGFEMKEDACKALYRKMDVDGDGRITEDEFVKLMRNMNREKLSSQLSTGGVTTKKPKAINITVLDLGYEGSGKYQEYKFTRQDINSKYVKELPKWKKHCRWIDIYGSDPDITDLIGNECDLSTRIMEEATVKHSGKVQYYPEDKALFVAVHALFLTKRPIQMRARGLQPAATLAALFSRRQAQAPSSPASPSKEYPLKPIERRRSIGTIDRKHFEGDEDDEAEDEEEGIDEKKEETETDHELVPERSYEAPRINMSQIVLICLENMIITVRRRSNNTGISSVFDLVKEDLKNFLQSEIRSSLEAPTPKDLLLTFLTEVQEHNYGLRTQLNEWKLALENDINKNITKYQARHLLDLNRTTSKAVQIIEPYVEDFVALTTGEEEHNDSSGQDTKSKLSRQTSVPITGDEKKSYHRDLASANQFIGDKKQAFQDGGESAKRLMSQFKYALESIEQLGTYYKHQMDDRQAQSLNYLTVITGTIFPFTMFTGVYGMNFEVLPELTYEYAYLLFWVFNILFALLLLKFWHSRGLI